MFGTSHNDCIRRWLWLYVLERTSRGLSSVKTLIGLTCKSKSKRSKSVEDRTGEQHSIPLRFSKHCWHSPEHTKGFEELARLKQDCYRGEAYAWPVTAGHLHPVIPRKQRSSLLVQCWYVTSLVIRKYNIHWALHSLRFAVRNVSQHFIDQQKHYTYQRA